jgi:hypothetical protein
VLALNLLATVIAQRLIAYFGTLDTFLVTFEFLPGEAQEIGIPALLFSNVQAKRLPRPVYPREVAACG